MSKIALITGITGQDGAYLAKLLVSKGYSKIFGVTRNLSLSQKTNLAFLGIEDKIDSVTADLTNQKEVYALLERTNPDEIYHLAAQSSVGKSFEIPAETFLFNTNSVIHLLEGIRILNPKIRFYHASSSEMFGNVTPKQLPISEENLFDPVSPYGISKTAAHYITQNYRKNYGIFAACGILFNHESPLRGENFVIKKIIHTALNIKNGLANQLIVGNIDISRDWGYAPAYVEAMWKMLQIDQPQDFIICSGKPVTLKVFIQKVFEQLDLNADQYIHQNPELMRKLELENIYGDPQKAKNILHWHYEWETDKLIHQLIQDEKEWMIWKKEN